MANDTVTLLDAVASHLAAPRSNVTTLARRPGRVVCSVATSQGRVVVKASHTPNEFDGEAIAMRRLLELGLPVSRVIDLKSEAPAMLVADWTVGRPVTADSPPAVLATVGACLARIHQVPARGRFSGYESIEAWVSTWVRDVVRWWSTQDNAAPSVIERTESWLSAIRPSLLSRTGTTILFDGRPDHFLVDQLGNVRMIDVADVMPGDPLMDLAVFDLHAPGSLEHVMTGYQPSHPADVGSMATLIPFYRFLRHVAGAEWMTTKGANGEAAGWHLAKAHLLLDQYSHDRG